MTLPSKVEIFEGVMFLSIMVILVTVPFLIGLQVCKYFRWGCG